MAYQFTFTKRFQRHYRSLVDKEAIILLDIGRLTIRFLNKGKATERGFFPDLRAG